MRVRPTGFLWLACLALLGLGACGGSQSWVIDDAQFLKFGVDPRREADALTEHLSRAGRRVVARIDGKTFAALELQDTGREGSGVRVVTERGIVLSFDAGDAHDQPGIRLGLVRVVDRNATDEATELLDLDRDGREEVFVSGLEVATGMRCIQGYRVLRGGHLGTLALEPPPWPEPLCVGTLEDIDGDGKVEGIVILTLWDLARYEAPTVRLPVRLEREGFVWKAGDPVTAVFLAAARAQLDGEIERARRASDVESAYRLGVERALYGYFLGDEPVTQLEALASAVRGLVLTPPQARAYDHARNRILAGWVRPGAEAQSDAVADRAHEGDPHEGREDAAERPASGRE